ncbi:conserved exported hypothetical protein [Rubrivivax sp. A210]|uniref:DUF3570 domain-containing protein n=1 Tax=Rubrivivax sp. A210 TaxID=2772301 RepID=UPI00199B993D|nr:DUF3570 domain-containing protein [Rubrivivax sp. A210]CAD5374966.1 conserved exported hypothetical protein [Rubrivivax sp. A210]
MDVTDALRRLAARMLRLAKAALGSLLAGSAATHAATLPEDKAEILYHRYDGGGVKASGPALLVRKSLADRVSASAQYYVDAVSNASIDVVTTASPYKETRTAWDLGLDTVVRDTTLGLAMSRSREPDYQADSLGFDAAHEVFGGMSTVSMGFTRGSDKVGQKDVAGWIDRATHWQYRAGLTQILSPRWLASVNGEVIADSGYLGSPYRVARVFGAAVHERVPRTRTGRAVKLRVIGDTGEWLARSSVRAEYRYYWDTWDVRAHTTEFGFSRYLGERFLLDTTLRLYKQGRALFYSDDAGSETVYVTRNRQLGAFSSTAFAARLSYQWPGPVLGAEWKLSASWELKRFAFSDFTDPRTGQPYRHNAQVLQLLASGSF